MSNKIEASAQPFKPARIEPLTSVEVANIATALQSLVGAQIQDCLQTTSEFGLAFHHERETLWLWLDLNPSRPLVVRIHGRAPSRKKVTRPLLLFVKAHVLGRRLESVRAELSRGRILILTFHRSAAEETTGPCEIEARLYPHGQNIIVRDGPKSVAWTKPKEVPPPLLSNVDVGSGRTWEEVEETWRRLQDAKPERAQGSREGADVLAKEWKRAVSKKEKALVRMREELKEKTSHVYSHVGEWLKINGDLFAAGRVPDEWRDFIDTDQTLAWNIENSFRRAKENLRKAEGTKTRIAQVEKELGDLKAQGPLGHFKKAENEAKNIKQNLLVKAEARGRRMAVTKDLEAYIGKSARDNLALLRRAQPFDFWLHLRDYPGSHAILRRTRGRTVTESEFMEVGKWVVEQSVGKRAHELKGEQFDMLIVECRYVRPIKGDKLGRVNYTNDRVLRVRF